MTTEMISQKPGQSEFAAENDNDEAVVCETVENDEVVETKKDEVPTYADAFPPLSSGVSNGNSGY